MSVFARVFQQAGPGINEVAQTTRQVLVDRVSSDGGSPSTFTNLPETLATAISIASAGSHYILAFVMNSELRFESEDMERVMAQLPEGIVVLLVVCGEISELKRDWMYYFGEAGPNAERLAIVYVVDEVDLPEAINRELDDLLPEI